MLNIEFNDENVILINIYAPTRGNNKWQKQFYEVVSKILEDYSGCNIIVGGVDLQNLQKQGETKVKQSAMVKQIYEITAK